MGHFLKNTTKYDTPDLREVVISRFVKDATNAFQNEQVLDLTEIEMQDIMEKKPEIAAKRVIDVLVKWARKRMQAETKAKEETKSKEGTENNPGEEKMDESSTEGIEEKKDEKLDEEAKSQDAKNDSSKDEQEKENETEKKEDTSETEKSEKVKDEKCEENPKQEIEEDFIAPLENLVKHVKWSNTDAEYYLKEVSTKKILSEDTKNSAMIQMLQSFVDSKPFNQSTPSAPRIGPKSAQQQQQRTTPQSRNQKGPQKRTSDGDCDVVMERISKVSKPSQKVKTEDEIL